MTFFYIIIYIHTYHYISCFIVLYMSVFLFYFFSLCVLFVQTLDEIKSDDSRITDKNELKKHSIRKKNQSIDNKLIETLKSIINVCFLSRTRPRFVLLLWWWTTAPQCLAQRHRAHYSGSESVRWNKSGTTSLFLRRRSLHTFWKLFNLVQEANQRRCEWFRTGPLRSAVWQAVIAPRRAVRAAGVEPTVSNSTAEGPNLLVLLLCERTETRHTQQLDREVAGQISPLVRLGGAPTASKMDLWANLSCVNINLVDVESLMSRVGFCLNNRLRTCTWWFSADEIFCLSSGMKHKLWNSRRFYVKKI